MQQLIKLKQQEEKKLTKLGQQRHEAANRLQHSQQQTAQLSAMLQQYQQTSDKNLHPLLLQNNTSLQQSLRPMVQQMVKKNGLLAQEQQRIDDLWRHQLQHRQRLNWLVQQRQKQRVRDTERREQQQLDNLAQRARIND